MDYSNQNLSNNDLHLQALDGANFTNANCLNVNFSGSTLTNANFTNALVPYVKTTDLNSALSSYATNFSLNNHAPLIPPTFNGGIDIDVVDPFNIKLRMDINK